MPQCNQPQPGPSHCICRALRQARHQEQLTVTQSVNGCKGFIIPIQPAPRQDQSRHRRSPRGPLLTPSSPPSPSPPTTMINDFTLSTQQLSSFSLLLLYQAYWSWFFPKKTEIHIDISGVETKCKHHLEMNETHTYTGKGKCFFTVLTECLKQTDFSQQRN